MMHHRIFGSRWLLHAMGILLLMTGCAEEWGAEPFPTSRVRGRVHQSGEPVTAGWLEFMPVDGTIGRLRSVSIGVNGNFEAEGIPIGRVALRLVGERPRRPEYAVFRQISLIRRSITEDGPNILDIDLEAERSMIASGLAP